MLQRDPGVYLEDIEYYADAAVRFIAHYSLEQYLADEKTRAAVERVLEVCGEAMNGLHKVAPGVAEKIPHARDIIRFRNILAQERCGGGTCTRDDDPLIWYEGSSVSASARRSLQANYQGSIVSVADASGDPITINRYDEYGLPADSNVGRFQYTGQAWLPELGIYYYKARLYDPRLGRFLQTDPVGYQDDLNLYAYTYNDPLDRTDPSGDTGEATVAGCAISAEAGCIPGAIIGAIVDTAIVVGGIWAAHEIVKQPDNAAGAGVGASNGDRAGKDHTPAAKKKAREINRGQNGGNLVCPDCGGNDRAPTGSERRHS